MPSRSYHPVLKMAAAWMILYTATFAVVLPLLFRSCNHSVYFTIQRYLSTDPEEFIHLQQVDKSRLDRARSFFQEGNPELVKRDLARLYNRNRTRLDLVISIVTAPRKKRGLSYQPDYLTQSAWSLLKQLLDQPKMVRFPYSLKVVICSGGKDPSQNKTVLLLEQYITLLQMPKKPTENIVQENEKIDYMACLNESLGYNPRYVLALEDDVLLRQNFLDLLEYVISRKLDSQISKGEMLWGNDDVAYVKLSRLEYVLGYFRNGVEHKFELPALSVFFGTLLALLFEVVWCRRITSWQRYTLWILWCLYTFLVILAIGMPCMMDFRRFFAPHLYKTVPALNCCTQAVLFPNHGAKLLVDYLDKNQATSKKAKDILMDDMLSETQRRAYNLFPNAVNHIGQSSSRMFRAPYLVY